MLEQEYNSSIAPPKMMHEINQKSLLRLVSKADKFAKMIDASEVIEGAEFLSDL